MAEVSDFLPSGEDSYLQPGINGNHRPLVNAWHDGDGDGLGLTLPVNLRGIGQDGEAVSQGLTAIVCVLDELLLHLGVRQTLSSGA